MLRIFFLFVVCSCTLLAVGQDISGNVYDQEGAPLPFSNVMLLNARDSSFVDGTVTDTKGYFSLSTVKERSYLLQLTMCLGDYLLCPETTDASASWAEVLPSSISTADRFAICRSLTK